MLEGRKEGLEPPPPLPAYKSILADCQLRQVDVYSRFIAGFIRGLKARAEILPLAHDPTHGDRLCNKLVLSSLLYPLTYQLNPLTLNYLWQLFKLVLSRRGSLVGNVAATMLRRLLIFPSSRFNLNFSGQGKGEGEFITYRIRKFNFSLTGHRLN